MLRRHSIAHWVTVNSILPFSDLEYYKIVKARFQSFS